jgi:iron complex transport system substrate-binding protein
MFRKIFLLTIFSALILSACGTAPAPAESTANPEASAQITFTDEFGNTVTLNSAAQRIVSLAPSVTESLFAIGAGGQVVGRTDYCDYPQETKEIPSIGGFSASAMSMEAIIALEPDLVIGGSNLQGEIIKALRDAGIPAFISNPASLNEIMDALILYGQVTGHADEAQSVADEMKSRVDSVKTKVSAIPADQRPKVFYEVWHEPLMSANGKTVVGELIETAGGVNIFADMPDEYPTISVEQIVDVDPPLIIGPSSHGDQMTAEVIGAREGWQDLSAVKNNAIYIVDGNIVSRSSPRIVDVLDEFAKILHPDLFK